MTTANSALITTETAAYEFTPKYKLVLDQLWLLFADEIENFTLSMRFLLTSLDTFKGFAKSTHRNVLANLVSKSKQFKHGILKYADEFRGSLVKEILEDAALCSQFLRSGRNIRDLLFEHVLSFGQIISPPLTEIMIQEICEYFKNLSINLTTRLLFVEYQRPTSLTKYLKLPKKVNVPV